MSDFEPLMRAALAEADAAGKAGELPIGAVVAVRGEIVSRAGASQVACRSQVEHAELRALRAGGERLWRDHDEAVLVSTLEPCPMCLGAAVMADVPQVVFALRDEHAGVPAMLDLPYVARHITTYLGGVLADQARAVVERYEPAMLELVAPATRP